MVIYPVDRIIHLSNNPGLIAKISRMISRMHALFNISLYASETTAQKLACSRRTDRSGELGRRTSGKKAKGMQHYLYQIPLFSCSPLSSRLHKPEQDTRKSVCVGKLSESGCNRCTFWIFDSPWQTVFMTTAKSKLQRQSFRDKETKHSE